MELVGEVKELRIETAKGLKGSVATCLWHELSHVIISLDAYSSRGSECSEEHLPNSLSDLNALVEGKSHSEGDKS